MPLISQGIANLYAVQLTGIQTITGAKTLISDGIASTPLTVQGVVSQSANLMEFRDGAGVLLSSFNSGGGLSISTVTPLTFTGNGGGTYTRTVVYQNAGGLLIDLGRATDAGGGATLPLTITHRGGGPQVTIKDGMVTDNGHSRAMAVSNAVMIQPGQDVSPNGRPPTWDGTNFRWSGRIIVLGAGRGNHFSTDGFYAINMPAAGVVIPGYGGQGNATVTAAGIPLNIHCALYAVLPVNGSSSSVTLALVGYTENFVVPANWCLVAGQAENTNAGKLKTGWGAIMDTWKGLTFVNSWTNYGAGYNSGSFYKDTNGFVHLRGLITGGTYSATVATLPAGYRPAGQCLSMAMTSGGIGRLDVMPDGTITAYSGSGWLSLENIKFLAEN